MPLIIDRCVEEAVYIYPPGSDTPIVVRVVQCRGGRTKLMVVAPADYYVSRDDLHPDTLAVYRARRLAKLDGEGGT